MKLVFRAINPFHAAFNTGNENDKLLFYLYKQYNILNTMFKFKCISNNLIIDNITCLLFSLFVHYL